ncbi:MAG: hypothetical protein PF495_13695 [Spirochaetales bacterium]|jgi:predicted nucleotidyltransferase|nr:hypothetical protein [Spirochaetales bacterium]
MREQRPDLFIAEAVEQTLDVLFEVYGKNLLSMAALYGSAAKGNFVSGLSDINMFVIIQSESKERLIAAAEKFGVLLERYRIKLLIMTELEMQESADMFPLEFLEIRETMKLLAGENLLETLIIDRRHYRHQLEERLRGSITMLRQLILISGSRKKMILEQFLIWGGKQDTLLRALIRLKDESSLQRVGAEAGPEVARTAADLYGVDVKGLKRMYTVRDNPKGSEITREFLAELLVIYEALAHMVNSL